MPDVPDDDDFDFETESVRLNEIKRKRKNTRQDSEADQAERDASIARVNKMIADGEISRTYVRGEPKYDNAAARWRVKVVEASDFTVDHTSEKWGPCDDREYRSQAIVDFQRRFCMGTLSVASTVTLEKIDDVARTNPHMRELTSIYRLHAAASLRMSRPIRYPHVLLLGPPGIGKTHVCRDLAAAMGMPFSVIDAPAMSGAAALSGRDKSWKSPSPGKIADALIRDEMASQMILIDELEKCYQHRGESDTLAPLHALLEPSSARHWRDECLAVAMDASWISVVATANSIDGIAPSLLDRFTIIEIERPDRLQLRKVIVSIASALAADHGDFFATSPIADDVVEILASGENTPRSIRQSLSMAFVHSASHGRRQVIPADLVAAAAMACKVDGRPKIGFMR